MQTILMVAHLVIAVLLVGVILIQRTSEDGLSGLSGGSGFGGVMSSRSTTSFFSKVTVILAVLFMINCLVLANLSIRQANSSIVTKIEVKQEQKKDETPIPMAQ